jgi:hypothetical protein
MPPSHRLLTLMLCGLLAGCGSSPSGPTTPPSGDPPPATTYTLNGRVVGTVTGEPIAGATVTLGGVNYTTDANGGFRVTTTSAAVREVAIHGDGLVTRETRLSVGSRDVTLDVIQNRAPFILSFFRQLARNGFESEDGLEPLRPIDRAPRIHIRTVDESGRSIDSRTLNLVEDALRDSAAEWSGGRLPLETVERGSASRLGDSGWVTVVWPSVPEDGVCGRATIGTTTGFIELHYRNSACNCGSRDLIAPRTVRHELGHIYGYWHTDSARDLMWGGEWDERFCDQHPTTREVEHAKYMYSRGQGNRDPDQDPSGTVLRQPPVRVVVN